MQRCRYWKQFQPRCCCDWWCCVDAPPTVIYMWHLRRATQHPRLKFGYLFLLLSSPLYVYLVYSIFVVIVFIRRFILGTRFFSPSFSLDTRSFSRSSSFFCCIFVVFLSAASYPRFPCVLAISYVSSWAPSLVLNARFLPVLPVHHLSFWFLINRVRPGNSVRETRPRR